MKKTKFLTIFIGLFISLPVAVLADGADMMSGTWGNMMNMMGVGSMMGSSWLVTLSFLVWLVVGILAIAWLWKEITKK